MDALASSEFAGFVFALAPFRTATSFGFPGNAAKLFHAVAMPDFRDQTSLGLRQRFLPRKGIFFGEKLRTPGCGAGPKFPRGSPPPGSSPRPLALPASKANSGKVKYPLPEPSQNYVP